jgi:hypothetical protein
MAGLKIFWQEPWSNAASAIRGRHISKLCLAAICSVFHTGPQEFHFTYANDRVAPRLEHRNCIISSQGAALGIAFHSP